MSENLDKKQIENLLPHREPMLLIDELINIKKIKSATAIVNVRKNSILWWDFNKCKSYGLIDEEWNRT